MKHNNQTRISFQAENLPANFVAQASDFYNDKFEILVEEMGRKCGSPIEAMFGVAFVILVDTMAVNMIVQDGDGEEVDPSDFEFSLVRQKPIGKFTSDFLIGWTYKDERPKIVIECDGHQFHEKTKEQAAHDKSRDRWMQSQGYLVFRFTGSEIYKNAFGCAFEVYEALLAMCSDARYAR